MRHAAIAVAARPGADADRTVAAGENTLLFGAGRRLTRADDNAFVPLRVPELPRAR